VIVIEGENVKMSLCTGGKSDDCDIKLMNGAKDIINCEVEEKSTNVVCEDETMKGLITGDNSAAEVCKVNINNITSEMEGKVELEVKFVDNEINFKLHKKFDDIKVTLGDDDKKGIKESESTTVQCIVNNGYPAPKVKFMLMKDNVTVVNGSESRFNVNTDDSITFTSLFTPSRTDQGLFVCCHAEQIDVNMNNRNLYKDEKMIRLDVSFAPKRVGEIIVNNKTASMIVESNPPPSVKWTINCEDDKCPLDVNMTEIDTVQNTEFATAKTTLTKDGNYNLTLSITSTKSWVNKAYVNVTITNSVDSIHEEKIQINNNTEAVTTVTVTTVTEKPANETSSNSTTISSESTNNTEEKSGNPGLTAFIVILVIAIVIGGIFYYRRWKSKQNERIPLTNGPSMSSLQ